MKNRTAYLIVLAPMLIWSSSYLLTRFALEVFPPMTLITVRIFIAVLLLLGAGLMLGTLQKLRKKEIKLFILIGLLQPFLYFICETYGLKFVSPTVVSVFVSTIPLFSPLLAFLFLRERISVANMVGIVVSLAGVMMLVIDGERLSAHPAGLLLLMIAVFAAVMYTVLLRKIPDYYSDTSIVFYMHAGSLLFFIPTFLIVDAPHLGEIDFRWEALGAIAALALFGSMLAFILFCKVVRQIGVTRANMFCNIEPGCTALLMLLVFGEQLSLVKWAGIAVVIAGLFISQIPRRRKSSEQ
ncbi:MAG: DMT family transporter [Prevotellaceae bacterium]|jgi:drug/metabolite transporter (DMT)-like permease|nr:DMT family transporter [Prevotellaceae bacterium]